MANEKFLKAAKLRTSGCPLFEDREKGDLADLEGEEVTLQRAWPLTGDNGVYFAVWFKEAPELFYLSSSALTGILQDGQKIAEEDDLELDEVIAGTVIKICAQTKTKNGRKFRPIEVIG